MKKFGYLLISLLIISCEKNEPITPVDGGNMNSNFHADSIYIEYAVLATDPENQGVTLKIHTNLLGDFTTTKQVWKSPLLVFHKNQAPIDLEISEYSRNCKNCWLAIFVSQKDECYREYSIGDSATCVYRIP